LAKLSHIFERYGFLNLKIETICTLF